MKKILLSVAAFLLIFAQSQAEFTEQTCKTWCLKQLEEAYSGANSLEYWYPAERPQGSFNQALLPENHHKNRFPNFALPYDYNLIPSLGERFINASPMKFGDLSYIAAQGPVKSTMDDFWYMVFMEKCSVIVTVTNTHEVVKGVFHKKFEVFWPTEKPELFGEILVTPIDDTQLLKEWDDGRKERIFFRTFKLTFGDEELIVHHIQMENWPDVSVIKPDSLFYLQNLVEKYRQDKTVVIHCAAGVGRTGTLIAAHSLFHEMQDILAANEINNEKLNVLKRVHEMRALRYGPMVGAIEQYHLIIDMLRYALENERT